MYKALWTPIVGEQLICTREPTNPEDRYSVAVLKADVVVGSLPRKFSKKIMFTVLEKRRYYKVHYNCYEVVFS